MNRSVPLVLAIALFMENMDSNVISTSLPAIADDLGTSPIALKLALTGYLVSLAIFIPISGWMADRFGAKQVFRAAIGVFVLGSLACAASNSLTTFVLARALQGMGGAMMTPVGRLLIVRTTPRHELVSAMAWLSIPAMVGPLAGPPIGGFITTYFTWHWIFIINVPIGILGIFFATKYLPDSDELTNRKLDWTGFVLSALGMSGLVFGLSVVSLPALPTFVGVSTLIVGVVASILYVWHAGRVDEPLLDLSLFKNKVFRTSVVGGSIFRLGIGAVPFLLPLMFQVGFGLSPFQSGMLTFTSAIGAFTMKLGAKAMFGRFGFRNSLAFCAVVSAVFIAFNGLFTPETPYWIIFLALLIGGVGRSLLFTGVNTLAYAEIPNEQTSQATPIAAVAQQVSLAIGVAIAGGILEVSTMFHGGELLLSDFHIGFFMIAAISGLAFFSFINLDADAGHQLSGRKTRKN